MYFGCVNQKKYTKESTMTVYHPVSLRLAEHSHSSEEDSNNFIKNPDVSLLILYFKRLKLEKILSRVSDLRKNIPTYSLPSVLLVALSTVLFRSGSKHAFHTEANSDEETREKIAKFCGCSNERLPTIKTVDDALNNLSIEEMNGVLMDLFEQIRLSKLFSQYRDQLLPKGMFPIAIDGETIHKYEAGCAHDCEKCPYCLKRQRGDTIWYHHIIVVASLVTPQGLKIPLYVYPIHAQSVEKQNLSDEKLKQECESKALLKILKALKERFPRLNICVLLDALYATGPSIQQLKDNNVAFAIVRKKGNMRTVGKDCDGLAQLPEHKEIIENIKAANGDKIHRQYQIFNDIPYQEHKLNIIRFKEKITNSKGKHKSCYKGEWIVSWRLKKNNCADSVRIGRLRWYEEDLFNTIETRGLNIRHDYSRTPNTQIIWVILTMLAMTITECFLHLRAMCKSRKKRSIINFMKDLFHQLRHLAKSFIFSAHCLVSPVQLRYSFGPSPP